MNTILMKEFIQWNSIVYLLDRPVMEKVIIGIVSGLLLSYTYVKKCKGNSTFLMLQT